MITTANSSHRTSSRRRLAQAASLRWESIGNQAREIIMATRLRFEVSDPVCGNVDHYRTRDEAVRDASRNQNRHQLEGDRTAVTVFDWMARHGAAEEWDAWGTPIAKRLPADKAQQ